MAALPMTGGCNCGAVRYEVTAELLGPSYCHCRRCQRRSGAAASPSAHAAVQAFRIVAGEDALKCWKPDDGGEKWFCGTCGSSIFARNDRHPQWIGVRMGTFDDDPGVRPSSALVGWVGGRRRNQSRRCLPQHIEKPLRPGTPAVLPPRASGSLPSLSLPPASGGGASRHRAFASGKERQRPPRRRVLRTRDCASGGLRPPFSRDLPRC